MSQNVYITHKTDGKPHKECLDFYLMEPNDNEATECPFPTVLAFARRNVHTDKAAESDGKE